MGRLWDKKVDNYKIKLSLSFLRTSSSPKSMRIGNNKVKNNKKIIWYKNTISSLMDF